MVAFRALFTFFSSIFVFTFLFEPKTKKNNNRLTRTRHRVVDMQPVTDSSEGSKYVHTHTSMYGGRNICV